jgi:hypothetical protein
MLLTTLVLTGCEEETPTNIHNGVDPSILSVNAIDKWNLRISIRRKIEVRANDPQGAGNLKSVRFTLTDPEESVIFEDSLYDDGAYFHPDDDDVVAGDGIFTNTYKLDVINPGRLEGAFIATFIVEDKNNHTGKPFETEITFANNSAPQIIQIAAPDTFPWYEPAIVQATVADSNGLSDISRVYVESENQTNGVVRFEIELFDDGDIQFHGDQSAGDGIYSAILDSTFRVGKQGLFTLRFIVEDSFGETNDPQAEKTIFVGNTVGFFQSVFVPDTMFIPLGSSFNRELITAMVQDPQGLADIDSVYFFSLKPDSSLANNGQPFVMVDNGLPFNINNAFIEVGDLVAGDGIYSFSLIVSSTTDPGTYTFTFYMRDRAGNRTQPQVRTILIVN